MFTLPMDNLIGHTIRRILVEAGENSLLIETDKELFAYDAIGDCCSESWFADIIGVDALLGGTVTEIVERELPKGDQTRTRQEVDEIYGIGIKTDKGTADVIFRNSSNGYYGGWLQNGEAPETLDDYREITSDWSA